MIEFPSGTRSASPGAPCGQATTARLWLDGRVSPTVRAEVLRYNRRTAQRLHGVAIVAGLVAPQTDPLVFVMPVELGDRATP